MLKKWFVLCFPILALCHETFSSSAYENLELLPYKMHGWHLHQSIVERIFRQKNIKTVVEVGSWLGNWTIFVAKLLPSEGCIYAVDHWKGSIEHHNPTSLESTFLPTLFQQFLSNVVHSGVMEKVIPLKMESLSAAQIFREKGVRADLIYIDAGHDYDSVMQDLTAWYPVVVEGGLLCGDDWNLGDVPRAVQDFGRTHWLVVRHEGDFWWYE